MEGEEFIWDEIQVPCLVARLRHSDGVGLGGLLGGGIEGLSELALEIWGSGSRLGGV